MDRVRLQGIVATVLLCLCALVQWQITVMQAGTDLASGYFACQLIANDHLDAVYSRDQQQFNMLSFSQEWLTAIEQDGSALEQMPNPYVQIPLWAAMLQPLCTTLKYPEFLNLFGLLSALAMCLMVWLCFRELTNRKSMLVCMLLVVGWLLLAHPGRYTLILAQTHPLLLLATLFALLIAERGRQGLAGLLLSFAAVIKVMPVFLLVYWALQKKFKAIAWCVAGMGFWIVLSVVLGGWELNKEFLGELRQISDVLLVSWNNQSFASLVMGPKYPEEVDAWVILPLPAVVKIVSLTLTIGLIALAGWLRQRGAAEGATISIALLAMTMFSSIAWSHYYIVLLLPMIWLMGQARSKPTLWLVIAVMFVTSYTWTYSLTRPLFMGSLLVLLTCLWLAAQQIRATSATKATLS
jgi:hypothetical protein